MNTIHLPQSEAEGQELGRRQDKVRQAMPEGMDAVLVADNANIFYCAGRYFRGYVYIPRQGETLYFVIRPVGMEGPQVHYIRKPEQIAEALVAAGKPMPRKIGLELDILSYNECARLGRCFEGAEVLDCTGALRAARMTKTAWEIGQMEYDGVHQSEAYRRVSRVFRRDMTDVEFQIEIERLLRLEGVLGFYRVSGRLMELNLGSVLCGANADAPSPYDFAMGGGGTTGALPAGANGTAMRPGTTVMVDMNGTFNGYQTDMTRTWRIGDVPQEARDMHECSRTILRALEKMGKPGVAVRDLYEEAERIVKESGFERHFMGYSQKAAFIGHGVGIQLNEQPVVMARSRDVLAEGMTLALEPKFVIPEVGAVGVENTYVVESQGLRCLTNFSEELANLL